jgi:hypothetical protein
MHEGAGAPLMRPQPDQPDSQRASQAAPRHAPAHSRSPLAAPPPVHSRPPAAAPPPGSVPAAGRERLAAVRPVVASAPEPAGSSDRVRPEPGQPGRAQPEPARAEPAKADPAQPEPSAGRLREHLEAVRLHAQRASSWLETSSHYARLVNRDGVVPVTARFNAHDLAFLAEARAQMLGFAELGLRLIELHQPLDAGGVTSDPAAPILRCRSCMWRWPCPTFRTLAEVLDEGSRT